MQSRRHHNEQSKGTLHSVTTLSISTIQTDRQHAQVSKQLCTAMETTLHYLTHSVESQRIIFEYMLALEGNEIELGMFGAALLRLVCIYCVWSAWHP